MENMMAAGRPTKYDPSMCEQAIELGRQGKSRVGIAVGLGVRRATLDNWAAEHPEFLDALEEALECSQEWWEQKGKTRMDDATGFSASTHQFFMKNMFRKDYGEKKEIELTGANGGPIKTQNTLDVSKLTLEELDALERALGGGSAEDDEE